MRISTLIGIILGLAAILFAFNLEQGDFTKLILPGPIIIVIGGTLMAGLASSSWKIFSRMFRSMFIAFFPPKYDKKKIILQILEFSLLTRKMGVLAIEDKLKKTEHPYIRKMFQMGIDGANSEDMEQMYISELERINYRHSENIAFFNKLGGLSPTMGIIGTVMGLISTMSTAGRNGDANQLIISISVAFLATLWGITMANLVWIPIADKLQTVHNDELQLLDVIFEGTKCVFEGDNTSVILAKLTSAYPLTEQSNFAREARQFMDKRRRAMQSEAGN